MDKPTKRRRWLFRPYLDRRDKIISVVAFLAAAAAMLGLGWISWFDAAVLGVLEAALVLVMPTRKNPEALAEAAALGIVDAEDARVLGPGEETER